MVPTPTPTIKRTLTNSDLQKQTSTVTFKFNCKINLHVLHKYLVNKRGYVGYCELESFPALALVIWAPLHVNIFNSGKVVITGVRHDLGQCHKIRSSLFKAIQHIKSSPRNPANWN